MENVDRMWGLWAKTCLADPVSHAQELIWCENGRVELGEELVDPKVESFLLGPEVKSGMNKNPGDTDVNLFALDHFVISFPIEKAIGLV